MFPWTKVSPPNITRHCRDGTLVFLLPGCPKQPHLFQVTGPGQWGTEQHKITDLKMWKFRFSILTLTLSLSINNIFVFSVLPTALIIQLPLSACLFSVWEKQRAQKGPNTLWEICFTTFVLTLRFYMRIDQKFLPSANSGPIYPLWWSQTGHSYTLWMQYRNFSWQ